MTDDFVHLNVQTKHSLSPALAEIPDLVGRAAELGMEALAITDSGTLAGAPEFARVMRAHGLKPLIGCRIRYRPPAYYDADDTGDSPASALPGGGIPDGRELLLLAQNSAGYARLAGLLSGASTWDDGMPLFDRNVVLSGGRGLIAIVPSMLGEVHQAVLAEHWPDGAFDMWQLDLQALQHAYPGGRLFVEIADHGLPEERALLRELIGLDNLVAGNDVRYVRRDDAGAYRRQVLRLPPDRRQAAPPWLWGSDELYLKSGKEMAHLFSDIPQALANTRAIAEMCDPDICL